MGEWPLDYTKLMLNSTQVEDEVGVEHGNMTNLTTSLACLQVGGGWGETLLIDNNNNNNNKAVYFLSCGEPIQDIANNYPPDNWFSKASPKL